MTCYWEFRLSEESLRLIERLLIDQMKKRMYWSGEESPFVEWCDFTDKKSIMINLSKIVFNSEKNFNSHLEVLKKISDKEVFYEADDCERYQFDVFSSEEDIKGSVKIYLSKIKYSIDHKESNGHLFRLDAYALLDIPNQFIEEGIKSETLTTLKVKKIEEKMWNSYRENKLAI